MDYPISILGYFVVGMIGAGAFLLLLLLFDKEVAILRNELLGVAVMAAMYVLAGGAISAILNLAASPTFGPGQFALAFGAGLGWPALATGIGSGKKVGELSGQKNDLAATGKEVVEGMQKHIDELEATVKRLGELALGQSTKPPG